MSVPASPSSSSGGSGVAATTVISTKDAPSAVGPYSQAVIVGPGRLLFCAGQIALDPKTGVLVGEGDVRAQAERVLENLRAVLAAADATFANVVKTTVFLTKMADFPLVNEVYGKFFQAPFPGRSTVEVSALPKGALVEVEAIAALP